MPTASICNQHLFHSSEPLPNCLLSFALELVLLWLMYSRDKMTFEKEPFRNYGCHSCMVRGPWDSVRGWGLQMGWQHLGEAEKGAIRSEAGGVPCVHSFEGGLETGCQREGLSSKASRGQQRLSLGSVGIDGSGDLWGSCASACPPRKPARLCFIPGVCH